jgi:hypothetical protein
MDTLFQTLGKIAGIAGLCIGLLLLIFRDVIRKDIFPKLSKIQAYKIIKLIIYFTFLIALIGLIFWFLPTIVHPIKKINVVNNLDTIKINANTDLDELTFTYRKNNDTLKIIDAYFDDKKEAFDIKVQNNSGNTIFINMLSLSVFFEEYLLSLKLPSGTERFDVDTTLVNLAYQNQEPFKYDKLLRVSYQIPPHDVDRYLIEFKLDKSKLFINSPGGYRIFFTFFYNGNQKSSVSGTIRDGNYYFPEFFNLN